jgi:hypothetical protein
MEQILWKYAPLGFLMGLALLIGLSVISYRSLNDLTQTADQVANPRAPREDGSGSWRLNGRVIDDAGDPGGQTGGGSRKIDQKETIGAAL